jgi:SAM-dependent methyltransferase
MAPTSASWDSLPDPGDVLVARSAGSTDRKWFYESGQQSVRELERTLALIERSLDSFASILDFGCGCGRMLLWLEELGKRTHLHGTDVDAEAIAWAAEQLRYCAFTVNQPEPPLPYGDGAFDLIFNHSVFTHIDERSQDAWLGELHRVTRPGGFLVLAVHGEWALNDEWSEAHVRLEDTGHLFLPDMRPPQELGHPGWYASAFNAPWYVFEHWGRWFNVRGYIPRAALNLQDHVLLERPAPGERRIRPLAARPPRSAPAPSVEQRVRAAQAQVGVGPSRLGVVGRGLRHVALRLMRPHTVHQQQIDLELAASIDQLTAAQQSTRPSP